MSFASASGWIAPWTVWRSPVRFRNRLPVILAETLEQLPTVEERRTASKKSVEQFIRHPETMCVSYPGNIQWGELSRYIRDLYIHTSVLSAPLMVLFHPMNGSFWFTFHQRDNTSAYADTFALLLKKHGIGAEVTGCAAPEDCRVYIP